tara:strand:- start:1216 stop:1986 length:771 start_codon:yes stop_codon:yes gene_type:complete
VILFKTLYKIFKLLFPTKFKKYLKYKIVESKKISDEKFYKVAEAYYSEKIETDGNNYEILVDAIKEIKNVQGIVCEIGSRLGGSAKWMIDTLVSNNDTDRIFIAIDPYGNIEYDRGDGDIGSQLNFSGYTNQMRKLAIPFLTLYGLQRLTHFIFFNLEDTEFFARYSDGIPVYSKSGKNIINLYSFVYFDGPHDYETVRKEVEFFNTRTHIGSIYVFDDVEGYYNHKRIEENLLLKNGWEIFQVSPQKISYKKVMI